MNIRTDYGTVKNVDINHMKEYGCWDSQTSTFIFTDYIVYNSDSSYLQFGFEVLHDKNDQIRCFVEEGFADGSADTYSANVSKSDEMEIKRIYEDYSSRR